MRRAISLPSEGPLTLFIAFLMSASPVAAAAPAMRCPMDGVLGALRCELPPLHAGVLDAPARVGVPTAVGRPPAGKPIYGTPYDYHAETENFTVNWLSGGSSEADAAWVGEQLEAAWGAYFEDQDWPLPVSSDDYLLWVFLDDRLGGTTGYTTEYTTADYPQGFPVIYLNPAYLEYTDFYAALAAHELMHAAQFRLRDWEAAGTEPWYWEASAQWAIETAIPENDVYAEQSPYYSWFPDLRFDSTAEYHQYGMFVFNAWLDDPGVGPGAMQAVWLLSEERPGDTWDDILAESTGSSAEDLWAGFTRDMGNRDLAESDIYEPVVIAADLADGVEGESERLGTTYLKVRAAGVVTLEADAGAAVLAGPGGIGSPLTVQEGDVIAVTGTAEGTGQWTLRVEDPEPADSGEGGSGFDDPSGSDERRACGCASQPARGHLPLVGLGLLGLAVLRRRR